jgi:hypothetical protein
MSQNHPLWKLKESLDFPPVEEAMLKLESNQAAEKYKYRIYELLHLKNEQEKLKDKNHNYVSKINNLTFELLEGFISLERTNLKKLKKQISTCFGQKCLNKGNFVYPKGGFRSWHTNKYDTPGWRMYIVNVDKPNQSFFRFKHPRNHEIYTHWEKSNCNINFFRIDPENILWHCIGSLDTNRWSKGFLIPSTWN